MAKIRVRKETGKLFFEFRYKGTRCREQTSLSDTKANRRKMQTMMNRIETEILALTFVYSAYFPDSKKAAMFDGEIVASHNAKSSQRVANANESINTPTFTEFSKIWRREQEVTWRLATQEVQELMFRKHIGPVFNQQPVHKIEKAEILEFRAQLAEKRVKSTGNPLSPKTINEIMGSLQAVLTEASDRYQFNNPCKNIKRLKVPKGDIHPFSLEEVSRIINQCRGDYQNYFVVRLLTGMRTGEVHGLKWKQVDFEKRQILVRETFSKSRTEYTKNDGSQREIDMSPQVLNALEKQALSTREMGEYVFCNLAGKPIDNSNFLRSVWKPLLRNLGLPARRPYQCRHTAATLWLAAGENPQWIARQLGHTTTEMLFRVYSRYVPNLTRQDGSAFERLLQSHLSMGGQ